MSRSKPKVKAAPRGGMPPEPPAPELLRRHSNVAALVFLAITLLVFFAPMVFTGKVFLPPDTVASQSHRPYLEEVFKSGEYPLWTPYVFSGMPSLGSLIAAPYTNPFSFVLTPLPMNLKLVAYYFLIGLFTYFLARRRIRSPFAALFAALSFVYCAHVIGWVMAGHNSKLATAVFMPAILLLVDRLFEKPNATRGAWVALAIGLSIVTSHMQITFYSLCSAGLLLLVMTVARLRAREGAREVVLAWALFGVAILVGLGGSAVISLPVREYAHYSIRGAEGAGLTRQYATSWSFHPLEMLTFLIPAFFGFGGTTYWGWMPFTDAPSYMGILPLFLAVVGFVLRRRERFVIYLAIVGLIGLFIAFGKEFPVLYDPLFRFMPFFKQFRVPSMALVLTQLSVALLAAFGLDTLLESAGVQVREQRFRVFRNVLIGFGAALILAGAVILLGRGSLEQKAAAGIASRFGPEAAAGEAVQALALAGRSFLLVLVFFAIGAGALWAWLSRRLSRNVALPVLLLVTLADLWLVGLKSAHYQTPGEARDVFKPTGTVEFLKRDTDLYRILPLTAPLSPSPNWWAYFRLQNAQGYNPAKLKVYQDMIDDQGPLGLVKPLNAGNFNFLRIANVRYLILGQGNVSIPGLTLVNSARGTAPTGQVADEYTYRVNDVLPRAFFVDRCRVISGSKALLTAMADPLWNPAQEALLLNEPGSKIDPAAGATVNVTGFSPHHIKATATATGNNLLYISEVYYPVGWTARIDGRETPILRANYGFRALVVPAGTHTITMDFTDPAFRTGRMVSIASYGLIALVLVAGFLLGRRRGAPVAAAGASAGDSPPAAAGPPA